MVGGCEEIENRLIESYRTRQHHVDPSGKICPPSAQRSHINLTDDACKEMKAALLASLRAKVASLEEDKWMFEAEDGVLS